MSATRLILASSSPRRSDLLKQLGVDFDIIPSDASEIHHEQLTARELCQLNAYRKARAVAKQFPDALVMGADTLVYLDTSLFGKPASRAEAKAMLKRLQGRTHMVFTGVCLLKLRGHQQKIFVDGTSVTFKKLTDREIDQYLDSIHVLDKAGAYAIQENGDDIIEGINGSWSNVVGLPLEMVGEVLREFETVPA